MISLGKIVKVRGIRGEVVIGPSHNLPLYNLNQGDILTLKSDKYQREEEIEYFREIKGGIVLKFLNIDTINEALKLVGYEIYADDDSKTDQKSDEIIGFLVKDLKDETWGREKSVAINRLNDYIEVKNNGDIYLVPFVDEIVKKIDEKERIIIIDPPDGLKDLN